MVQSIVAFVVMIVLGVIGFYFTVFVVATGGQLAGFDPSGDFVILSATLLVSLSGAVAADRILAFVTELVGNRDIEVTLLRVGEDEEPTTSLEALLEAVPDHDTIVMGEQASSLQSFLFGEVTERVAAASVGPVLVVRRNGRPDG